MASPPTNTKEYKLVQVQEPVFLRRQVFVKAAPGVKEARSGTETSPTNWAELQGREVGLGAGEVGTGEGVARGSGVAGNGVGGSTWIGVPVGKEARRVNSATAVPPADWVRSATTV